MLITEKYQKFNKAPLKVRNSFSKIYRDIKLYRNEFLTLGRVVLNFFFSKAMLGIGLTKEMVKDVNSTKPAIALSNATRE
jgi:hypothetical protein